MPYVNPSNTSILGNLLRTFTQRLTNLERQQNTGVTDSQGNLRVKVGLQSDGTYGIWIYEPGGNLMIKIGDIGGTTAPGPYGQAVFNGSAAVGPLPPTSAFSLVSPPQEAFHAATLTVTSTSFTSPGTSPSVTVAVGPAGKALIMPSAVVGIPGGPSTAAWQGSVGVAVDGGTPTSLVEVSAAAVAGAVIGIQETSANSYMWKTLSAGSHTFKLWYKSTNGQRVQFSDSSLIVIPY